MNLALGRELLHINAALSGGSKLIFLAWLGHVANVHTGTARSLWVLGANDLLAFWVVAVATSVASRLDGTLGPQIRGRALKSGLRPASPRGFT